MDKHIFFQQFNEALMKGDLSFILASVTDDVSWKMIGNDVIEGKGKLANVLGSMDHTMEYNVKLDHIIIQDLEAAVNGMIEVTTSLNELKTYGFCDIYLLNNKVDGKIKEIKSYVIQQ
ncbi:nuclear transport factor 2 family protein [Paraliobacillus ryukyuensis]|uniref:nuclear transport factor 2 family protein n=1 Tax=Paraliobacillus ryukyuensis TaxID=200904 RepID=UPI0009A57FC4|nr:nuclear transport factor 2 family protein [Paraliobacillus ryukyuensis]